jgi:hypothetical protein
MASFSDKVKVLLGALPAQLQVVSSAIAGVAAALVPALPVDVGVKVAALAALAVGWIATAVKVVSNVTPVLFPEDVGLAPVETPESTDFFETDLDV